MKKTCIDFKNVRFNHLDLETPSIVTSPSIVLPQSSYLEGMNISLTCSANGNPQPYFSWFLNGILLENSHILNIFNATSSNSGSYICQAANNAEISTMNSKLEIKGEDIFSKPNKSEKSMCVYVCMLL